jgi:hypothetical protein
MNSSTDTQLKNSLSLKEADRSAYPRLIFVILYTDHVSPAKSRQVGHQLGSWLSFFPNIQESNFGLY